MPWFHVQLLQATHCNFSAIIAGLAGDGKYSWQQHFRLMTIFHHVGKRAFNAKKLMLLF